MIYKSEPIESTALCEYGCGQIARFKNKKKKMCSSYHTSCPANKKKNSIGGLNSYINTNRKISVEIDTSVLCMHGCGQVAKYLTSAGKSICAMFANSCPQVRTKNSNSVLNAYKEGRRKPATDVYKDMAPELKARMNWNKGKRYADFSYEGKGQHKSALIQERGYKCECCNLSEWLGKPIKLELDHVSGDRKDNRRENLKLLCLNCHAQTPTWKQGNLKGWKVKKYPDEVYVDAIKTSKCITHALKKLDLRPGAASTIVKIMGKYKVNFLGADEDE